MASRDQSEDSLLKRQLVGRVTSSFISNEYPDLGGVNSNDIGIKLGRSQTPLQGALSSPSITSLPNHLPPGLQSITRTNTNTDIKTSGGLTVNNNAVEKEESNAKNEEGITDIDRYGLNGLLTLIRMENSDQTTVAIGTDLNILGLDMTESSIDVKISKTFPSPWIETSRSEVEPQYVKPDYFKVDDVPSIEEKLTLFTDETLFYIFYTRTRDVAQELSARELMNRNWRYHKELQVWLTKDSNTEPVQQSAQSERGIYIFFDPHSWEKVRKELILYYQSIMS